MAQRREGTKCACVRDDALDCARARYRDAGDEPCECLCHELDAQEAWQREWDGEQSARDLNDAYARGKAK